MKMVCEMWCYLALLGALESTDLINQRPPLSTVSLSMFSMRSRVLWLVKTNSKALWTLISSLVCPVFTGSIYRTRAYMRKQSNLKWLSSLWLNVGTLNVFMNQLMFPWDFILHQDLQNNPIHCQQSAGYINSCFSL